MRGVQVSELEYKYIYDPYTTLLTEPCTLNDGRRQLHGDRKKINKSNQDLIHLVLAAAYRCFGAKNI